MRETSFIFVYGTLRKGAKHPAHRLLAGRARFIGTGKFQGKLYDLGRFPAAVASDRKSDRVTGEVYRLDDPRRTLELLDHYEGKLFRREVRPIRWRGGAAIDAWVYLYGGPLHEAARIRCGDYAALKRSAKAAVRVRKVSTRADLEKAFAIRTRVFVKEQGVPQEMELDRDDRRAIHFLATRSGKAIGTARVAMRRGAAKIGRMAVLRSYRKKGVGKKLLRRAVFAAKQLGAKKIYLHAQVPVIGFYERFGFRSVGPAFDEAGIPHRKMVLPERNFAAKRAKDAKDNRGTCCEGGVSGGELLCDHSGGGGGRWSWLASRRLFATIPKPIKNCGGYDGSHSTNRGRSGQ